VPYPTFALGQADYLTRLNALSTALDKRLTQNILTNGSFQVWQRGTTFAAAASRVVAADRWHLYRGAGTLGATASRQTGTDPSRYCLRLQRDSGNTAVNVVHIYQPLTTENTIPLRGRRLGIRFRARAGANFSATTSYLYAQAIVGTGTDQGLSTPYTGEAVQASVPIAITTSWAYYTADLGTVGSTRNGISIDLAYTPVGTAGAADYVELQEVQVVTIADANVYIGDYPWRTFEEELAACQPYYEKSFPYATTPAQAAGLTGAFAFTQVVGASTAAFAPAQLQFKARKRTTPTVTLYNPINANAQVRNQSAAVDWSASTGATLYETGFLVQGTTGAGSAAGNLSYVHWTADAEL
jgi:hypothetical protein